MTNATFSQYPPTEAIKLITDVGGFTTKPTPKPKKLYRLWLCGEWWEKHLGGYSSRGKSVWTGLNHIQTAILQGVESHGYYRRTNPFEELKKKYPEIKTIKDVLIWLNKYQIAAVVEIDEHGNFWDVTKRMGASKPLSIECPKFTTDNYLSKQQSQALGI